MMIFIRPLDTQFHRSGLPFDAGQDTEATGLFPPWPRTVYGAIRAEGFQRAGIDLNSLRAGTTHEVFGGEKTFGSLVLKGPLLASLGADDRTSLRVLLPFPRDLLREKERVILHQLFPDPQTKLEQCSGFFLGQLSTTSAKSDRILKEVESRWLSSGPGSLGEYLCGGLDEKDYRHVSISADEIYLTEPRVGIMKDKGLRTAASGMIYQVQHHRLQDMPSPFGFIVDLCDFRGRFPDSGVLRLGGDGRPAAYQKLGALGAAGEDSPWWQAYRQTVVARIAETGRFKLYLTTPGLFRHGAMPDICELAENRVQGSICLGREVKQFFLVGACIGKRVDIGGWDIQRGSPKNMRKAVPAGSVYFFEFDQWEAGQTGTRWAEELWDTFHFNSLCSMKPWTNDKGQYMRDGELGPGKEGFGLALIGGW